MRISDWSSDVCSSDLRIDGQMENILRDKRLVEAGIDTAVLNSLNVEVSLHTSRLTEEGEARTSAGASYGVALTACILIYMFIFLYEIGRASCRERVCKYV